MATSSSYEYSLYPSGIYGMMVIHRCRVEREVMGLTMIRMGIISMGVEGTKDFAAMGGLAIPTVQNK